jgi:hypothetical protein
VKSIKQPLNALSTDFLSYADKRVLLLISENISVESLLYLKTLEYKKNINIRVLNSKSRIHQNFFFNFMGRVTNLSNSKCYGYLIAVNPKVEASLINLRLRYLTLREDYTFYNFGYKYMSFTKTNFVNFDLNEIFNFISGKSKTLSVGILNVAFSLIIFGASIYERVSNSEVLEFYLKKINPSLIFFNILLYCNSYSINFLNIAKFSTSDVKKAKSIFLYDFVDLFFNRKYILSLNNKKFVALRSFSDSIKFKNGYEITIKSFYEQSETYINFEFRPQKTEKLLEFSHSYCPYALLNFIFSFLPAIKAPKYSFFLRYLIEVPEVYFSFSVKKKINENIVSLYERKELKTYVSTYVLKPQYQCFFSSGSFSKASLNMLKASQEFQKNSINFI